MKVNPIQKRQIRISSKYGVRQHPVTGRVNSFHNGVDIPAYVGTPIIPPPAGRVVVSRANRGNPRTGYGYYMVVQYDGYCVLYAHMMSLGLPVGVQFDAGKVIGYTGNSGRSTGPHLHLEVRLGVYDNTFFKTDEKGKYYNSVDPETFEPPKAKPAWINILNNTMDQPEDWIKYLEEEIAKGEKNNTIAKFLPQFIEKLGGREC